MSISSSPFPKAILYTYERECIQSETLHRAGSLSDHSSTTGSLWSTVPRLALIEKGYSKDDLEMREVDLAAGENFSPAILRVNSKGTLPVLVVPLAETTGTEVDTKFRALTESKAIVEFLGQSVLPRVCLASPPGPWSCLLTCLGKSQTRLARNSCWTSRARRTASLRPSSSLPPSRERRSATPSSTSFTLPLRPFCCLRPDPSRSSMHSARGGRANSAGIGE